MNGWMDGRMGGWMDEWMDGWMGGWMDKWVGGWTDGWNIGCMNMNGWTEYRHCMHTVVKAARGEHRDSTEGRRQSERASEGENKPSSQRRDRSI